MPFGNVGQFLSGGEASPFAVFIHNRQTSATPALNPMRFFWHRHGQIQAQFQWPKIYSTFHRHKPNAVEKHG
jgi:hypothetical protein